MLNRLFVEAFHVRDFSLPLTDLTRCAPAIDSLAAPSVGPDGWPRINANRPMIEAMMLLEEHPVALVEEHRRVVALIHPSGLNLPAPRMWLFGMVGVVDRHVSEAIRLLYPRESWRQQLPSGRLALAERLLQERTRRGERPPLEDCLQIGDKVALVFGIPNAAAAFGYRSRKQMKRGLQALETLRNRLAHHQDIHPDCTEAALGMARRTEDLLVGARLHQALGTVSPDPVPAGADAATTSPACSRDSFLADE